MWTFSSRDLSNRDNGPEGMEPDGIIEVKLNVLFVSGKFVKSWMKDQLNC